MITAREKVRDELLLGALEGALPLTAVDSSVTQWNPSASATDVQNETIAVIRSLVSEGLFVLGDLSGEDGRLVTWNTPLDELIQKISNVYITQYDDPPAWVWSAWMELTDKGRQVARKLEATSKDSLT
ncbi:hypothetical protein [Mycobacterium kyorinense]|uniref:hypothetical protein n=1 Tax=Mycobacterium kyorinense TaxID=487514 RepID=UPI000A99BDEC|nr:hypothetical protein [Mycobacterium kyorinense]